MTLCACHYFLYGVIAIMALLALCPVVAGIDFWLRRRRSARRAKSAPVKESHEPKVPQRRLHPRTS